MTPARGKLFVRPIETPETLPGGKVLLTPRTREALTISQVEVVSVGAPEFCKEENCERRHRVIGSTLWDRDPHHYCDADVGDWIIIAHRSLSETHQDNLYCVSQEDVLARIEP